MDETRPSLFRRRGFGRMLLSHQETDRLLSVARVLFRLYEREEGEKRERKGGKEMNCI